MPSLPLLDASAEVIYGESQASVVGGIFVLLETDPGEEAEAGCFFGEWLGDLGSGLVSPGEMRYYFARGIVLLRAEQ